MGLMGIARKTKLPYVIRKRKRENNGVITSFYNHTPHYSTKSADITRRNLYLIS